MVLKNTQSKTYLCFLGLRHSHELRKSCCLLVKCVTLKCVSKTWGITGSGLGLGENWKIKLRSAK